MNFSAVEKMVDLDAQVDQSMITNNVATKHIVLSGYGVEILRSNK